MALDEYRTYRRARTVEVLARKLTKPELVRTYNGVKQGNIGDYIVDDDGTVMLCQGKRFESRYEMVPGQETHGEFSAEHVQSGHESDQDIAAYLQEAEGSG